MLAQSVLLLGAAGLFGNRYANGTAPETAPGPGRAANGTVTAGQPAATDAVAALELSDKQLASVKVEPVGTRDFETIKTAVGTIDFNQNMNVQVFAQYTGKILKAFYNVGDEVKRGDILFTIDSPDLLQAESSLLSSAGVLELQTRNLHRLTQLLKAGGSAQKDVDQATSDHQTAEGNFKAARDAVRIFGKTDAEIDAILAQRKLDSTLLVPSPISGRIVARNAAPGLLTQPGSGTPPYSVADLSTMWMIANVVESDAPAYALGQAVEATVSAWPGAVFKGRVTTVGTSVDPTTHRLLVRSQIADPEHRLRPGMFASFVTHMGDAVRSPAVPEAAVVREGDGTMTAWVTADRRRFVKREIRIGLRQDGYVQVLDGLAPGDLVATDGAVFLSNKYLLASGG